MKSLWLTLVFLLCLSACQSAEQETILRAKNPTRINTTNEGGVDVGNMTSSLVPQSSASISHPESWAAQATDDVLSLENKAGSRITARRANIVELVSPSALSIQKYLEAKFPERRYEIVSFNGLSGVRAELGQTGSVKESDIYLISELNDFLHLHSRLQTEDNGITEGEKILQSVRVKYRGVALPHSSPKTVTLIAYSNPTEERKKAAYSLAGDCHAYLPPHCRGVVMIYGNGQNNELRIGAAGYDHGRIIDLGSDVSFDAIRIEGEYLTAPDSKIPISDIYTAFTVENPQQDQDSLELKNGHVYLVRSISWPEEDLITKIKVEHLEDEKSVTLTYQKLVQVPAEELQKNVDIINRNTLEREQPRSTGEVTLFNRSAWKNYYHASFNFEYSTSGNMFITRNSWDLRLDGSRGMLPQLYATRSASSVAGIVDLGKVDLSELKTESLPDPNEVVMVQEQATVTVGHSYLIYHSDYSGKFIRGAVRVLEMEPTGKWVRLEFKRIAVTKAEHFQIWKPLDVPSGLQTVELIDSADGKTANYFPFISQRGDQGYEYQEDLAFSVEQESRDKLRVDPRPFENDRGFYRLPKETKLEDMTIEQVESLKGRYLSSIELQEGDVYAVLLENYFHKTLMVMKVVQHVPGKSVKLSVRYLSRAETPYHQLNQ